MRALGYFRPSLDESVPIDEMERAFVEYCSLNMHQPVRTFVSEGLDAADPEFLRMVAHMQTTGSQFLVVVPDARHLGADLEKVARAIVELDTAGALVACYDEDFPDPFQNAFQTLGIKGVSRTRSRRIKESMRARALKGQALGRPLYGYRIGPGKNLEVVPEEAPVVELIYRLYTKEGLGLRLIAQHLNERSITTRRGSRWNVASIRDLLKNPTYTGTYARLGVRRSKVHEAIIPAEVFRAAQDQTRARRPVGRVIRPEPFLLSGSLYCGYCGNKMMGVTRRQSWKRMDGGRARQVYRYYQCQSRNNQSVCGYHTWRAALLESTVLSQLKYALRAGQAGDSEEMDRNGSLKEVGPPVEEDRVTNAERRFLSAMKRAARGGASVQEVGRRLKELDAARKAASATRDSESPAEVLDQWEDMDLDDKRSFIAEHVTRVVVEDDKVEVLV